MLKKAYACMGILLCVCIMYKLVAAFPANANTETPVDATASAVEVAESEDTSSGYDVDTSDWRLILVNKTHTMPEDYTVTTTKVGGKYVDERIADDLTAMIEAAAEEGVTLRIGSAYRDVEYQAGLVEKSVAAYIKQGYTEEEARELTGESIADPYTSEHSLGLAIDFAVGDATDFEETFKNTEQFAWLSAHAAEYGFICRYPEGKEDITKYTYEPWHYRYVGVEHATVITADGICLEEYLGETE